MTSQYLFITGMPRSGTTLLDKLLSQHPQAHILSQPLPLLYVELKRAFLKSRGQEVAYPFGDMFGERWYDVGEFSDYLAANAPDADFYRDALEKMRDFDGQYTKPDPPWTVSEGDYHPFDFVTRYCESFSPVGNLVVGSKETFCEEMIPYFLKNGAKVLVIVRDPRDVLASLNHGRGLDFGGRSKPHLFNLRQWRKSVAFIFQNWLNPNFLAIRYEDLVQKPEETMQEVTSFLGLESLSAEILRGDLKTQSGNAWSSNSSHRPATKIDAAGVGRYRDHLDAATDQWVQAVCYPEMYALSYTLDLESTRVVDVLSLPLTELPLQRPELAAYQWSEERRDEELGRWQAFEDDVFDPQFFLFEDAFTELRAA